LKATAVVVNDDYVTMSSINRDEDGVVKFSWIAGEKSAVKAGEKVVSVTFTGDVKNAKTISVTGQAYVGSEKKAQAVEDTVKVETSESTEETTTESAAESTTESSEETTTSAEEGTTGSETETTESAAEGTDGSVTETTESAEGTTAAVESGSEEDETTSAVSNGSQNSSNGGNNTTTGNTAGNTANGSTNVKTGDETNAGWYMALLVVAALGIAGYFAVQRKRRNEK
jgi:LPXTG-motif cell wall-anchored protein